MYKIGDTPKFLGSLFKDYLAPLTIGQRYEIVDFDEKYKELVFIINDLGKKDFWNISRFEPYKEYQFHKEIQEIINE